MSVEEALGISTDEAMEIMESNDQNLWMVLGGVT